MANQTIPITLTWGPTAVNFIAGDINELGDFLAKQMSGAIRADVSFLLFVLIDPTTYQTDVIFNGLQRVFKAWDTASGTYQPITPFSIYDVKTSYIGADQISIGWVLLDGRAISAIPGLSAAQQARLETLFTVGGSLPIVTPSNIQNLPAADAFSGITKPTVTPANGVIGALTFTDPATAAEAEALRDATETLRDSTASVETQVAAIQDAASDLLAAVRGTTTPQLHSLIFVGFA